MLALAFVRAAAGTLLCAPTESVLSNFKVAHRSRLAGAVKRKGRPSLPPIERAAYRGASCPMRARRSRCASALREGEPQAGEIRNGVSGVAYVGGCLAIAEGMLG
jgi:hypothetical protein